MTASSTSAPERFSPTEFAPWRDPDAVPLIRMRSLTKSFGNFTAVDGIDLDIYPREFFSLLGPSGCGKTTIMRMLAGFEEPSAGDVTLEDSGVRFLAGLEREEGVRRLKQHLETAILRLNVLTLVARAPQKPAKKKARVAATTLDTHFLAGLPPALRRLEVRFPIRLDEAWLRQLVPPPPPSQ